VIVQPGVTRATRPAARFWYGCRMPWTPTPRSIRRSNPVTRRAVYDAHRRVRLHANARSRRRTEHRRETSLLPFSEISRAFSIASLSGADGPRSTTCHNTRRSALNKRLAASGDRSPRRASSCSDQSGWIRSNLKRTQDYMLVSLFAGSSFAMKRSSPPNKDSQFRTAPHSRNRAALYFRSRIRKRSFMSHTFLVPQKGHATANTAVRTLAPLIYGTVFRLSHRNLNSTVRKPGIPPALARRSALLLE